MPNGQKAKLYRNTGTDAVPVWVELTEVIDLDIPTTAEEYDDSNRGSKYNKYDQGLVDLSVTGNMTYRNGNTNCDYIRDALLAGTSFQIAAMDGDITTSGVTGPRFFCKVFDYSRSQPLKDGQKAALAFKPCYHEESSVVFEPTEYTVP